MALAVNGGAGPVQPNQPVSAPQLTQPDQARVQEEVRAALKDGMLDQQDLGQLRSSVAQKLFPDTPAASLKPDQLTQVDALLADALDGQLDQRTGIANIQDVMGALSKDKAGFAPIGFRLPEPGDDSHLAVQFSTSEVLKKLMSSPDKADAAKQALQSLCDGFAQAAPASQPETFKLVMQSGTPEQKRALGQQLSQHPEILATLADGLRTENLGTPESAALSALIMNSDSPGKTPKSAAVNKLTAQLTGLNQPAKVVAFYNQASKAIAELGLDNTPRSTPEKGYGVGRKLAEAHFKNLSAEAQFQLLMDVEDSDGDALLRPLIRSLDQTPEKKEAIRKLAHDYIERFKASEMNKELSTYNGPVVLGGSYNPYQPPPQGNLDRARLILKILDEPGDGAAASPPAVNTPVSSGPATPAIGAPKPIAQPTTPKPHPQVEEQPPLREDKPTVVKPAEVPVKPAIPQPAPKLDDFSTEEFIKRLRAYRDKPELDTLLKDLQPEHKVKLARMLDACQDGHFQADKGGRAKEVVGELSPEAKAALAQGFEADAAKLAPGILKGLLQHPDTGIDEKGQILGYMLDTPDSRQLAFNTLKDAHDKGSFGELMPKILHEGYNASSLVPNHLPPEQAGQVLAWAADANRGDKGYLTSRLEAMGNVLNGLPEAKSKAIVRAFAAELKTPSEELLQNMSPMTLKTIAQQLERGGLAKSDEALYTQLSTALVASNNLQIADLLARPGLGDAHVSQIQNILQATQDDKQYLANVEQMLTRPDKLPTAFAKPEDLARAISRLSAMGDDARARTALQGLFEKARPADIAKVWAGLDDKGQANPDARALMFYKFVDQGNFEMSKLMLRGDGKLPAMDAKHVNTQNMLDFMSEKVTKFSNAGKLFGGNNDHTAEAMLWILKEGANGGKARINLEQAFKQVDRMKLGNDAEVVRKFMDQVKASKEDLKGKLTLDMVRAMGSSLDSGYEKTLQVPDGIVKDALNFYLGGNRQTSHEQSVAAIKDIGRLVNADGKAALIRELMSGTTYDIGEEAITDLISMAQRDGQLPDLARQLDFKQVAGELADNTIFTQVDEAQIGSVSLDLGSASRKANPADQTLLAGKADQLIAGAPGYANKVLSMIQSSDPQMLLRMNLTEAARHLKPEDLSSVAGRLKGFQVKAATPEAKALALAKLDELARGHNSREAALALIKDLPDDLLKALPLATRQMLHKSIEGIMWNNAGEKAAMARLGV